ncbi:MAG: cobalamin-binding protein, partial [Deltaproteobacteria bacterium]|nr:cobalamin-binding protein [Deltaproteobacteria bacterium]
MKKTLSLLLILCSSMLWANGNSEKTEDSVSNKNNTYPQRIISLSPSTTETLFAIGAGDQVVGVTEYCDFPAEAASREKVGGYSAKTISIETIISLNPDLVIAGVAAHQPIADTLRDAGIPVLSIEPKTIEDIQNTILELAIITGHETKGKEITKNISERLEFIEKEISSLTIDQRISVFYEVWDAPLMTAGPGSFTGQMIEMAGGINIFSDASGDYPQISSEELISRNPKALVSSDTHG